MKVTRSFWLGVLVPTATLALVLIGWHLAAAATEPFILPSPAKVAQALFDNWDLLISSLGTTLRLTAIALLLSVALAVALAVLMAQSRWAALALYPYAVILQVTPIIAITPMILVWVKDTNSAILLIAFIIAFFPVLSNTVQGLRSADHNLLNLFDLYRAGRWRSLWLLKAPAALPYFLTGLRTAGGLALIGVVVAELAAGRGGAGSGLAYRIVNAQHDLDTARAFAALLLLAVVGVGIFALTSAAAHYATRHWHESAAPREN